jgi:V/A-type H+-transporting ATPase subunit A
MEEIPGEDAFPAYLDSSIKTLYERAGAISCPDGSEGSLTMIGTVSPPGGNFEEPVTRATLATVKAFLGLSYDRAYRRFYPAIDPLISWSRYLDQLQEWFHENLRHGWTADVKRMLQLLHDGDAVYQMMQVTGEEGVSLEDYILWQKSTLLDRVFLQQDAFDPVDMAVPRERQLAAIDLLKSVIDRQYNFSDKDDVRIFFTHITGLFRNWNYASAESPDFHRLPEEIQSAVDARAIHRNRTPSDPGPSAGREPMG